MSQEVFGNFELDNDDYINSTLDEKDVLVPIVLEQNDSLFHELMDDVKEIAKSSSCCSNEMKSYLKNELGRLRSETIQHVKNNFQPNKMECDNDNICEQEDQEVSTTFCSPFPQTDRRKQDVRLKRYSEK